MDPIIVGLAGKAMTILMPFAARTAGEFVGAVGEVGYEKAKGLFSRLKEKWAGDTGSTVVLESFEKQPESFQPAMQAVLQQKLADDPELREEVSKVVEEMGPTLEILQKMDEAEGVTGLEADELARGRVSVTQEMEKGTNVTGAKLGRIG